MSKAREIHNQIRKKWTCTLDTKGSIGRRYSRADEIGIVVCITVDFQTLEDSTITVRDRDTTRQYRIKISDLGLELGKIFDSEC